MRPDIDDVRMAVREPDPVFDDINEHHAYWNRHRRRFRQIEAGLRISMKRQILRLSPQSAGMFTDLTTDALRILLVHLRAN
jgi:hypothetical protein